MTSNDVNIALSSMFSISPVSTGVYEIKSKATFQNGESIKIYLVNEKNEWYLTDKKNTLKYMNEIYDLKASDVKSCISAVIKIYGFTITAGELRGKIFDEIQLQNRVFDYIMCIAQLVNMYAFFDKPE